MMTLNNLITAALAALLVTSASAQSAPPGGPGGPPSGGGGTPPGNGGNPPGPSSDWTIEYKGSLLAANSAGWNQPNWGPSAPAYGYYSYDPNGSISGTVYVRLTWNPTDREPPKTVNLDVSSAGTASSGGTASVDNGFESKSNTGDVSVSGKYLVQKAGAHQIILSYSPSVSGASNLPPGRSRTVLQIGLSVALDPRYVSASYARSFKKGGQVSTTRFSLTTTDGVEHSWTVPTYDRILNETDYSGNDPVLRADIGLPLMSYRLGPTESVLTSVFFSGGAAWAEAGMPWFFTVSPDPYSDSLSGVHDSSDPISESLNVNVQRPQIKTQNQGGKLTVDYIQGQADTTSTVTFKTSWSDGLKGQAKVSAQFYPEARHIQSFPQFGDPDKESPVDQLTSDGKDLVSYQTDAYETGGTQGSVGFKLLDAVTGGISIALSAWQPETLPYVVALAATNKALDAVGPWAEPEKFTYNRNSDVLNPQDMIPGTVYTSYDWIGTIRPETLYTPHEVELYNAEGFLYHSVVLQTQVDPTRGRRAIRIYPRNGS